MGGVFRQTICMKAGWIIFIGTPNWTPESAISPPPLEMAKLPCFSGQGCRVSRDVAWSGFVPLGSAGQRDGRRLFVQRGVWRLDGDEPKPVVDGVVGVQAVLSPCRGSTVVPLIPSDQGLTLLIS